MNEKTDLRVQRTRRLIRETFEQMICEQDFEQITVQALSEQAGISRKTFYRHYQDLDDLLREFQAEMASEFIQRTAGLRRPYDMDQITREFFLYCEQRGKLTETLVCDDSYTYIGSRITARIMNETWEPEDVDPERMDIISTFVAQSTLAVYRRWVAGGRKMPLDEITDLAARLICSGLDGLALLGQQTHTADSGCENKERKAQSDGEDILDAGSRCFGEDIQSDVQKRGQSSSFRNI